MSQETGISGSLRHYKCDDDCKEVGHLIEVNYHFRLSSKTELKTGEASRLPPQKVRKRSFTLVRHENRAFPENDDVAVITWFPWPSFPKTEMACDFVIAAFPNSSTSNLLSNAMRFLA